MKYVIKFERPMDSGSSKIWSGYINRISKKDGSFQMDFWKNGGSIFSEKVADEKIAFLKSFDKNADVTFTKEEI